MRGHRAFVALGSNAGDPPARLTAALAALDASDSHVAACSRLGWSAYVGAPLGEAPARVLNAVAEVRTRLDADAFHQHLHAVEAEHGRRRDGGVLRTLDLDLLTFDDEVRAGDSLCLPHPRCLERAFVLEPWEEIAPRFVVPGSGASVLEHRAAWRAPPALEAAVPFAPAFPAPFAPRDTDLAVLQDAAALASWRDRQSASVGVVMTMGALHAGHASLVQRAAAECDAVLATVFVNPTQFGPGEDLQRYPRTFASDCDLLRRHGAHAVYAPTVEDLYPAGLVADVEPGPIARVYEGAARPTHFAGVATVVARLWRRTRATRSYFGQKDAQQLAMLRDVRRGLGLDVEIVGCEIVRDVSGLALSSRNRYLDAGERERAGHLARALQQMAVRARTVPFQRDAQIGAAVADLEGGGLEVDYVDVVDAERFEPVGRLAGPALAIGAVRLGTVRLIDNRWIAPPVGVVA